MPAGLAQLAVMPEPGRQGEQSHPDPREEPGQGAGAVALQPVGAVGGAEQIEAKAPEEARMASAIAVGGGPRELEAPQGSGVESSRRRPSKIDGET